jgi:hypothetical protein
MHVFLTSALAGGEWSASRPGRFNPGERAPSTHWIGGWVGPSADMEDVEKRKFLTLPGLDLRPLPRPARIQSLYRPRYPGSFATSRINLLSLNMSGEWVACYFNWAKKTKLRGRNPQANYTDRTTAACRRS